VAGLLADPVRARVMGEKGRSWVERDWTWARQAARLDGLLTGL
jgi:phosphatidylinositol alpha-1,6-mannosyltransferase